MRTVETTLYNFDELSERAQSRALDAVREWQCQDSSWYEFSYEDFERVARILGIEFDAKPVRLMNGDTRYKPAIWFSGFYCQGDGLAFDGSYRFAKGSQKAIREYAPTDTELHRIADELAKLQRPYFYALGARVKSMRDTWCDVDVYARDDFDGVLPDDDLTELMRDFAHWMYRQLRAEYEYQTSDDAVRECIEANEYEFTEDGVPA